MKINKLIFITLLFVLASCHKANHSKLVLDTTIDHHSFANSKDVVIEHIHLDMKVRFENNTIEAINQIRFKKINPNAKHISLDTRGLKIRSVRDGKKKLKWEFARTDKNLGKELKIQLPEGNEIYIDYITSPGATGLQWVTPEQTSDKKQPFL